MPEQIKKILDTWNPIGLTLISPDEYLPVAEHIADSINEHFTPHSVCIVLKRAFSIYGVNFRKSNDECMAIAEKVGVGAVVFYYLSNNRMRDINFMLEDALSFDGNTGPYAQYTYARCSSLLEKAGAGAYRCHMESATEEEVALARVLALFPEKIQGALSESEPSVVTRYILELCAAFNRFSHDCQILSAEDEAVKENRLALTQAVKTVLGTALHLICMPTPNKI